MVTFTRHDSSTAGVGAAQVLARVKDRYGFVPNLAAYLAESPPVLDAVLNLGGSFERTSFSPREQQIVLLAVSAYHGCGYCQTVHTALALKVGLDRASLDAVLGSDPLPDARENVLRDFTRAVVASRGEVAGAEIKAFLDAGYTRAQVFECVLGVALKTLTNFCNHLAGAEPNPEFVAMARLD